MIDQLGSLLLWRPLDQFELVITRRQILERRDSRMCGRRADAEIAQRPDRDRRLRCLADADERRVTWLVDVLHYADDGGQLAGDDLLAFFHQLLDFDGLGGVIDGENLR